MRGFIVMLVLLVASSVLAQAPGATPPRGAGPPPPPAATNQNRRDKIKKRIRALRAYTLTEELSLDELTAGKLFPLLSRYDDELDKLLQLRAEVQRKLDAASGLKDPRAIDKVIDEAVANQRAFFDLEDKRLAELRKILTPQQIARLLIVLPALEKKIQNQLQKAIKAAQGAEPDDDDIEPDEKPRKPKPKPKAPCDPFSSAHC